ncbi:MAG: Serine/threonine protein kinase [Anaerolineales bacterium]|nr:Serine/threonine protein kinase [Anaerolineales bacterium]
MTFAVGENVGPYRIIEQLGQGGMATVHKAYHAALDRYVAIKVLHPAFLQDPNFLKRFQREAKAVARLEHPNIVPVYDFAEHAGQPYLVMKYIEGDTLKARLRSGRLSKEEGLHIVEAAGSALSYAHQRTILHRDIKPSNILISPDGSIYLADFGLARMGEAGESTLSADMMLGTPQYISPEQARGEKNLDAGTDIYSFGVVLYEMVVGRVPFNADTPFSIIHDHIYKPLPIPSQINPRVPAEVERVLLKSLAKERADRYASVDDMVAAFRHAVSGTAAPIVAPRLATPVTVTGAAAQVADAGVDIEAAPPGAVPPSPPRNRRRWLWIGGGLAMACLCGFLFLSVAANSGEGDPTPTPGSAASEPLAPVPTAAVEPTPLPQESGAMLEARTRVSENPEDPNAHVALAEVLRSQGHDRLAMDEYLNAADLFLGQQADLEAAMTALQGLYLGGGPAAAGARADNLAVQAMFLAADNPGIVPLLTEVNDGYPDWPSFPAIAARAALYLKDDAEADRWLGLALDNQPGDHLARSVRAEMLYMRGEPIQAQAFARQILEQPRVPAWLADHLKQMIADPPVR